MPAQSLQAPDKSKIDVKLFMQHEKVRVIKGWNRKMPDEEGYDGPPIVRGIGSSELKDADGDVMHLSALESMCTASAGMCVWLGHKYELPDMLFGALTDPPILGTLNTKGKEVTTVNIDVEVEDENPEAMKTFRYMEKGRQLGFSVGCMYTDFKKRLDARGRPTGVDIYEVMPLEWSVTGIPSNRESWITDIVKSMQAKGILPTDNVAETCYVLERYDQFDDARPGLTFQLLTIKSALDELGLTVGSLDRMVALGQKVPFALQASDAA